ncbi:HdeD family acid-resistance protein [Sphingobacterium sp. Mn56C]|uniref:HdeD family acid-resistance protein n=1 Tax=Sphingobacterium sp. Mn56C TaxID=3395261 RepID=UPI003BDD3CD7
MATNFFKTVRSTVKNWYIPLIIGILLIVLGIYTLSNPVESYLALSLLFTWYFLLSGILEIGFAISNKDELDGWGWSLASGILYTLFGVYMFVNPAISITTLPFVIGFYALFKSIQLFSVAFELKAYGTQKWGWVLAWAILGIVFSFILLWNPIFAGLSLVIYTGLSIISIGLASVIVSFQLKRVKDFPKRLPKEWQDKYEALKSEYHQHINPS